MIQPACEHCETKRNRRQTRTIKGKTVLVCDPCFVLLSAKRTDDGQLKYAKPKNIATAPAKLEWGQTQVGGNIVHTIDIRGIHAEVHELYEYRHGRSRPPTRQYFLMMRPIVREFKSLAVAEEYLLQ